MRWSLGIGMALLVVKLVAYFLTRSAAVLGDAAESIVHVMAVAFAAYSLHLSEKPADRDHPYGHAKITFFSAGIEGAAIVLAACYIIFESIRKTLAGGELERLGAGLSLTVVAVVVNAILGFYLLWLGRQQRSLILEANGKHVLTDSYTSLGTVLALVLVAFTGWRFWDPIFGVLIAGNIFYSGIGLMRRSVRGLMDQTDPQTVDRLTQVLDTEVRARGLSFHLLRHRNLGNAHWVDFHLQFPEDMPVGQAHDQATAIEAALDRALPGRVIVTSHIEPEGDHAAAHQVLGHEEERLPRSGEGH